MKPIRIVIIVLLLLAAAAFAQTWYTQDEWDLAYKQSFPPGETRQNDVDWLRRKVVEQRIQINQLHEAIRKGTTEGRR